MLWDDKYFYIAAELEEPHVWATLTKHDSVIFHDNDFEVFIDPDGDNHEYYEFEINALNTELGPVPQASPTATAAQRSNDWEIPGLKTAVHVDGTLNDPRDKDKCWSVELAFPWEVLAEFAHRPAPAPRRRPWRVNFSRVEWQHVVDVGGVPQGARHQGGQLGLVAARGRSTCTAPSAGATSSSRPPHPAPTRSSQTPPARAGEIGGLSGSPSRQSRLGDQTACLALRPVLLAFPLK